MTTNKIKLCYCLCSPKIGVLWVLILEALFHAIALIGSVYYFIKSGENNMWAFLMLFAGVTIVGLLGHGRRKRKVQYLLPYLVWKPLQILTELGATIYYIVIWPNMKQIQLKILKEHMQLDKEELGLVEAKMDMKHSVDLSVVGVYTVCSVFFIYTVVKYRNQLKTEAACCSRLTQHPENADSEIEDKDVVSLSTISSAPPAYTEQAKLHNGNYI